MSRSKIIPGHDYKYDSRGCRISPNRTPRYPITIYLDQSEQDIVDELVKSIGFVKGVFAKEAFINELKTLIKKELK